MQIKKYVKELLPQLRKKEGKKQALINYLLELQEVYYYTRTREVVNAAKEELFDNRLRIVDKHMVSMFNDTGSLLSLLSFRKGVLVGWSGDFKHSELILRTIKNNFSTVNFSDYRHFSNMVEVILPSGDIGENDLLTQVAEAYGQEVENLWRAREWHYKLVSTRFSRALQKLIEDVAILQKSYVNEYELVSVSYSENIKTIKQMLSRDIEEIGNIHYSHQDLAIQILSEIHQEIDERLRVLQKLENGYKRDIDSAGLETRTNILKTELKNIKVFHSNKAVSHAADMAQIILKDMKQNS